MKRILLAFAAAAGLTATAGSVKADPGGFQPPGPNGATQLPTPGMYAGPNTLLGAGAPGERGPGGMYGLNPALRKGFRTGGCNTCGGAGGVGGYGYPGPYQQPPVMQGTLVFPNHPYMRSPRDFFMYEPHR
jgi:hypothetical protein